MPDSSALWIVVDGNSPRQMFEVSRGHEVWVIPQELPGGQHYRRGMYRPLPKLSRRTSAVASIK